MRLTLLLIPAFCFFFYNSSFSQKSYYKKGRATIYDAKIVIEPGVQPFRTCKIKTNHGYEVLGPEEITEYKSKYGHVFISYDLGEEGQTFIERTVEGPLQFYFLIDQNFKERYFVQYGEDPLVELQIPRNRRTKDYKEILHDLWSDCDDESLENLINTAELTRPDLERIVRTHNDCEEPYVPVNSIKTFIGPGYPGWQVSGRSNSRPSAISQGTLALLSLDRSISYGIGGVFEQPLRGSNAMFGIGTKLTYYQFEFFSLIGGEVDYTMDMKLLDIGIPVVLSYQDSRSDIRPFVGVELVPSYFIVNDVLVRKIIFRGQPRTDITDFGPSRIGVSGRLNGGVRFDLNPKIEFIGEIGYDHRFPMLSDNIINPTGPYLQVGLAFRSIPVDPNRRRRTSSKRKTSTSRSRKR